MGGDDDRAADAAYSTERKLEIGQQGAAPAASESRRKKMSTATVKKRKQRSASAVARDPRRKAGKWPGSIGLNIDPKVFARLERARKIVGKKEGVKRKDGISRSKAITRGLELWLSKVGV